MFTRRNIDNEKKIFFHGCCVLKYCSLNNEAFHKFFFQNSKPFNLLIMRSILRDVHSSTIFAGVNTHS